MVLKSELNSSNKISAINALAVPVVTYSINIINWQMKEDKKIIHNVQNAPPQSGCG